MSGARRREEPPHAQQHALANGGGAGPRGSVWGKALRSDSAWHDKVRGSAGPGWRGRLRGSAAAPLSRGRRAPAPRCWGRRFRQRRGRPAAAVQLSCWGHRAALVGSGRGAPCREPLPSVGARRGV